MLQNHPEERAPFELFIATLSRHYSFVVLHNRKATKTRWNDEKEKRKKRTSPFWSKKQKFRNRGDFIGLDGTVFFSGSETPSPLVTRVDPVTWWRTAETRGRGHKENEKLESEKAREREEESVVYPAYSYIAAISKRKKLKWSFAWKGGGGVGLPTIHILREQIGNAWAGDVENAGRKIRTLSLSLSHTFDLSWSRTRQYAAIFRFAPLSLSLSPCPPRINIFSPTLPGSDSFLIRGARDASMTFAIASKPQTSRRRVDSKIEYAKRASVTHASLPPSVFLAEGPPPEETDAIHRCTLTVFSWPDGISPIRGRAVLLVFCFRRRRR